MRHVRLYLDNHMVLEAPELTVGPENEQEYFDKLAPGKEVLVSGKYVKIKSIVTMECSVSDEIGSLRGQMELWKARFWGMGIAFVLTLIVSTAIHVYYVLRQQGVIQ
jgi:hypothetical protein